jgi:hypothetical protein
VRPRQARYQAALRPDIKCFLIIRQFREFDAASNFRNGGRVFSAGALVNALYPGRIAGVSHS